MFEIPIKTTKNIQIYFSSASLMHRILAKLIDMMIQLGYLYFIYHNWDFFDVFFKMLDSWEQIAVIFLILSVLIWYPLLCEMFMSGQTIGKKLLKIRVVKIEGYQADFYDFFIRALLGFLEVYMLPFIGILSVISTKYSQRLGDILSGTAVISESDKTNISHSILEDVSQNYQPFFTLTEVLMFSDKDVQTIKKYYEYSIKNKKQDILTKISEKIIEITKKQKMQYSDADYIKIFLKDYTFLILNKV